MIHNEQEIKKYIIAKTYTTYPTKPARVTVTWEALEYNQYKKAFTAVASAETESELLDELDRRFNGGSEEDKIKERIQNIDPELLKRVLEDIKREEEAANPVLVLDTIPVPVEEKIAEKPSEQAPKIEE